MFVRSSDLLFQMLGSRSHVIGLHCICSESETTKALDITMLIKTFVSLKA